MTPPSILLIIPYFGRFNNYFNNFLSSCKSNRTINWLIITDDETKYNYPENVKVIISSFDEIKNRIQSKFDFKIELSTPYKLCDYKPAYGFIFSDEIKNYDFWGYCDTDLIFGDIRSFLTPSVLNGKEKVLSRGHLSLYRNNKRMNTFFMNETNGFYKTVYTSNLGFAFDEWGKNGISHHLKEKLSPNEFWDEIPYDDLWTLASNFIPYQKRDENISHIAYHYKKGQLVKFGLSNGEIYKTPVLYAHFQKRHLEILTMDTDNYMIIPNKIINETDVHIDKHWLTKYCSPSFINKQYLKIRYQNFMKKLRRNFGI